MTQLCAYPKFCSAAANAALHPLHSLSLHFLQLWMKPSFLPKKIIILKAQGYMVIQNTSVELMSHKDSSLASE